MKKIVISNYDDIFHPTYAGGGARAMHEIATRLRKKYEVTVLTGRYLGARTEIRDGVTYKRTGLSWFGPKIGQLLYSLTLPYHVLTAQYDVWLECFTPPFSANFLQLFTAKPVIGVIHMLGGTDMERKYKLPVFRVIEKLGIQTYKHIITVTDDIRHTVHSYNPACHVVTIPNGVSLPAQSIKKAEKHILFLGRLEVNQKGIDLLVKAFRRIASKKAYNLILAGSGSARDTQTIRDLIQKLHLTGRVTLAGRTEGKEKQKLLAEAAFVVVPSRYEAFGMVILEAFSYGKPVITFDNLTWVPKSASLQAKAFQESSLAENMLLLSQNAPLRSTLGKNGSAVAKQYSWENIAKQYARVIETSLI